MDIINDLITVEQLTDVELYALSKPADIARIVAQSVEQGDRSGVELLIAFNVLKKTHDLLRADKRFMEAVEREIERTKEKGNKTGRFGYVASLQNRTDYDFSTCNDPYLERLEALKAENDKAIETRKTYLKALQGEASDANSEGAFILPPSVSRKTIVSIT